MMKKLLGAAICLAVMTGLGCATIDYPIVTDDRGDYSGIIRTAHKAYIQQTSQVATFWADGSDELFSMVYQNQYGDQKLYTFNNFDPTGANWLLDQTYCDWRYEGCELVRAWNPIQNDDPEDYELFDSCSGARSLSLLVGQEGRVGECGDTLFGADMQGLAGVFASLDTTQLRGETAYVLPISTHDTSVTLTSAQGLTQTMPIFGTTTGLFTDDLNLIIPMTPNTRHQLTWVRQWAAENGSSARVELDYQGVSAAIDVTLRADGLAHNQGRY